MTAVDTETKPAPKANTKLAEAPPDETAILDATPSNPITFSNGQVVRVKRLKTAQFFALMRVITTGAPELIFLVRQAMENGGVTAFAQQLMATLVFAIPNAEPQVYDLILKLVELEGAPSPAAEDSPEQTKLRTFITQGDADMDDLMNVLEVVVDQEKSDLASLGKRLTSMWKVADKTGQV